mmetsp:Transcript_28902/g.39704  ORF Transcript_28902/g.39704 Transcript_28902/m.39704 type:complete len:113 (-) Transcript_28902:205-543(-)
MSPMKWACRSMLAEEFKGQQFDDTRSRLARQDIGSRMARCLQRGFQCVAGFVQQITSKRTASDEGRTDGDRVLCKLGIPRADYASSNKALIALFLGHVLVALIGLVMSTPTG